MASIEDDAATGISRRIRTERADRGWSLSELAVRSGVSKAMLSAIERQETSPTAALLVRIAAAQPSPALLRMSQSTPLPMPGQVAMRASRVVSQGRR